MPLTRVRVREHFSPHNSHYYEIRDFNNNIQLYWAVVVAQLVERSLPIPEVHGSNPVISKNLYWTFTANFIEKMTIRNKRLGMAHFFKKHSIYHL